MPSKLSRQVHQRIALLGRILLASLFMLGGINKIMNYGDTLASMTEAGMPWAALLLPLTIAFEIIGGGLVIAGRRFAALAAMLLAGFTILTNIVFHRFWEMSGEIAALELSLFFKNIAIAGGLLCLAAALPYARNSAFNHGA